MSVPPHWCKYVYMYNACVHWGCVYECEQMRGQGEEQIVRGLGGNITFKENAWKRALCFYSSENNREEV